MAENIEQMESVGGGSLAVCERVLRAPSKQQQTKLARSLRAYRAESAA